MEKFEYSKYQLEIFDVYNKTRNNLVIEACPGSGKTFTLLELLKITPPFKSSIFLAFNASIAKELKEKVPLHSRASTIHSLGFGILNKLNDNKFKVNEIKNWIIGKKILKLNFKTQKQTSTYLHTISKLVDLYRMNLCETKADLINVAEKYNISILNGEIGHTFEILHYLETYNSAVHDQPMMVDFVDMIYLPLKLYGAADFPKFNLVMVDECQDISRFQYEFILRLLNKRSRTVFVGDSKQAIYSFMGADSDIFQLMKQRSSTKILPLSYSYRCGSKIVEEANKIFDVIESPEGHHEGEVIVNGNILDADAGDFILCRNNLPLIQCFLYLISNRKSAKIIGKDYGEELLKVLFKMGDLTDEAEEKVLLDKAEKLKASGVVNITSNKSYVALIEKIVILKELHKSFENIDELKETIQEMFSDNKNDKRHIMLSSIHKAKGLEANNIFAFGFDELIPSKYAETALELYAERCLYYVGVTRAIKKLIYVKLNNIV